MAVVLKNKKTKLENLGFAHFCGGGGSRKVLTRKLQFSTMRKKILTTKIALGYHLGPLHLKFDLSKAISLLTRAIKI